MNRDLKIAILEKLSNIMDEADYVESMYIDISYSPEEVPQITYRIKENIVPEEDRREINEHRGTN
jgi:hypothetical protein